MQKEPEYLLLPDTQLFDLVRTNDDEKAFEQIYIRYFSTLTSSASKLLRCEQKAEDIVQEIFLSLYNRRSDIELTVSLRAYLWKAVRFKIMNEYRSRTVREAYQQTVSFVYGNEAAERISSHFEAKELYGRIDRCVNMLPDKCRKVFLLSRAEDLSYKDISGHLGISVSTVEKHISKALRLLRVNLNGQGFSIN